MGRILHCLVAGNLQKENKESFCKIFQDIAESKKTDRMDIYVLSDDNAVAQAAAESGFGYHTLKQDKINHAYQYLYQFQSRIGLLFGSPKERQIKKHIKTASDYYTETIVVNDVA